MSILLIELKSPGVDTGQTERQSMRSRERERERQRVAKEREDGILLAIQFQLFLYFHADSPLPLFTPSSSSLSLSLEREKFLLYRKLSKFLFSFLIARQRRRIILCDIIFKQIQTLEQRATRVESFFSQNCNISSVLSMF